MGRLLLDNPLGNANAGFLIEVQRTVAAAAGIELIYTTGIADLNALRRFSSLIAVSNDAARRTMRRYVRANPALLELLVPPEEGAGASQPGEWWGSPTMKPAAVETPLARRFAAALAGAEPGRARIRIETYAAAFLVAEPALATSLARRARLGAAIEELIEAGTITASRAVERSELPPLPRFIVLLDRVTDPPVGRGIRNSSRRTSPG